MSFIYVIISRGKALGTSVIKEGTQQSLWHSVQQNRAQNTVEFTMTVLSIVQHESAEMLLSLTSVCVCLSEDRVSPPTLLKHLWCPLTDSWCLIVVSSSQTDPIIIMRLTSEWGAFCRVPSLRASLLHSLLNTMRVMIHSLVWDVMEP